MMTNILPIVPTAFTFGMRASLHGDAIFLAGEATSPGVYFYKVTWNGEVAADGKLTRVQ